MFNCPNCWENPCICGQKYQTWSDEKIRGQIKMLDDILKQRLGKLRENQLPERIFTEKDLIQLGLKPSSQKFGEILNEMYDAQLNGKFDDNIKAWKYLIDNFSKRLGINGYIIRESKGGGESD